MYYASYGLSIKDQEFNKNVKSAKQIAITKLKNMDLCFKGFEEGFSFLSLEPGTNEVPIVIYKIDDDDIKALEKYECYPSFNCKKTFKMNLMNEEIEVVLFVAHQSISYNLPSLSYLRKAIKAYEYNGFDTRIIINAFRNQVLREQKKEL